jgi:hypothetical protein
MNKFEQLIEYVINDEEAKARELFHDIVVEKSRQIYEEMMEEETIEEAESTHDEDEKAEKAGEKVTKDIEYDDKKDRKERKMHEAQDELGGDQADDLIDDIEVEEEGLSFEGEGEDEDDEEGDEDLEDRVVDLEDKLDELMAEFEALMGDDKGEEMDMEVDMDMDTPDMDAEEVVDDEMETEGMMRMPMEENVELKAAPKPVTSEEGSVNKKAVYAVDSGAKGAVAKPDNLDQGGEAKGRPAPKAQDMGMTMQPDVKPATKPHLAQATGVNVKSPLPGQ